MFDGMVKELKGVRYVPQLKRNLISVGALEASGMVISVRDGDLRMIKGSMVVMKGVRRGNLYYLKGSTITDQVETLSSSDDGGPEVWQGKVGQEEEKSLRAPAKMESLEGAATYKLEGEHSVLDKKKLRFNTSTHCNKGRLDCVHVCIWGPAKTASLGGHMYFVSFIDSVSRQCWIYPMRQCSEALDILVKWKGKMKRQIGRRIKELKIGNVGKDMYQFLRFGHNTGIVTHFTTGTDELAKEVIRPLLNEVRRLLSNTGLDKSF